MERPLKHKQSTPLARLKSDQSRKLSTLPPTAKDPLAVKFRPHRLCTEVVREDPHWEFIESRRESHLNALFNRRKTVLETISRKNKDIYQRIVDQESHYSQEKAQFRPQKDKNLVLETLTNGSRMLLTLSRQAMAHPKLHIEAPVGRREIVEKENEEESLTSIPSKLLWKPNANHLSIIAEENKTKIVESRLISNLTSRMLSSASEQITNPRGCSVGRRRLQDLVLNF